MPRVWTMEWRLHITILQIRENRIPVLSVVSHINTSHNLNRRIILYKLRDHLTHMTIAAMHNYLYHFLFVPPVTNRNESLLFRPPSRLHQAKRLQLRRQSLLMCRFHLRQR